MRIMGLDFGSKTVGVAISDPLGITAQGIEIIRRERESMLRHTLSRLEELILEYQVEEIVLGFPKNMNDTVGERAQKSLEFKEKRSDRHFDYECKCEKNVISRHDFSPFISLLLFEEFFFFVCFAMNTSPAVIPATTRIAVIILGTVIVTPAVPFFNKSASF